MKRPRNARHRDKDEHQKARELADIKSQNNQLRRQVARLQREVDRLECLTPPDDGFEVEEKKPKRKQKSCQECSSIKLKELLIPGGKSLLICMQCKSRQTP